MFTRHHVPISVRRRRRLRRYLFLFLFLSILIGALYLIFFTSFLRVQKVIISGNKTVAGNDIVNIKNLTYIFEPIKLASLPIIADSFIKKDYLNRTISIKVIEKEAIAIWCHTHSALASGVTINSQANSEKNIDAVKISNISTDLKESSATTDCVWFDRSGLALRPAPVPSGLLIPVIYGPHTVKPGEYIISENMRLNAISIISIIKDAPVSILKFSINDLHYEEMIGETISGTPIYFSLRLNPDFILGALNSLIDDIDNLEYIDLRSANRAYYKRK